MTTTKEHADGVPDRRNHSRRGLLAGAAGALGALAAESVVTAQPAQAALTNSPVLLNQDNSATAATGIGTTNGMSVTLADPAGFGVVGNGGGNGGIGVAGFAAGNNEGVQGMGSGTGAGVFGTGGGSDGTGVSGTGGGNGDGV